MSQAWIGFGSNLGDRARNAGSALAEMEGHAVRIVRTSHLYETTAEPDPRAADAPLLPYLNAVVHVETELPPLVLLATLQSIERTLGRVLRAGPRTCDLDLLAYEGELLDGELLALPHPRLSRRAFVLVPLCELDPLWRHPRDRCTAAQLLAALEVPSGSVRLFGPVDRRTETTSSGASSYAWRLVPPAG